MPRAGWPMLEGSRGEIKFNDKSYDFSLNPGRIKINHFTTNSTKFKDIKTIHVKQYLGNMYIGAL